MRIMPTGHARQAIVLWTDERISSRRARAIDEMARTASACRVGVGTREGDVVPVLDADGRVTDVNAT